MKNNLIALFALFIFLLGWGANPGETKEAPEVPVKGKVPIFLYHRFGPVVVDSMTVTTPHFESQLKFFKDHNCTVIPLRQLVDYYLRGTPSIPPQSVVISVDDGHKSVYTDMLPLLKKYHVPVTLFLYPSAISNAPYALTWEQLRVMKETGLFDMQSHTFWHPNFKQEKKKLNPLQYKNFVNLQFKKSKERLEKELAVKVDMLAWPFGIYDEELIQEAAEAGYVAAYTIERRDTGISDNIMALPRYLMVDRRE